MTEAKIDVLATRVAVGITNGITTILGQHEDGQDDTALRWRNAHSVDVRDAIKELIRALANTERKRTP